MKSLAYIVSGILLTGATVHCLGERPLVGVPVFLIPAVFGIMYGMGLKFNRNMLIFIFGYIALFGMYFMYGLNYNLFDIFTWEALGYPVLSVWMAVLYFFSKKPVHH